MKKRIHTPLLILLLLPILAVTAYARQNGFVIDNAVLLSNSEEDALQNTISVLRDQYHMDIVILTESSLHGERPQDHADLYYAQNDFSEDGILFLLSMEERDWYISTCGNARYAFTDYGIQCLGEMIVPYLAEGDYHHGFAAFLEALPQYFDAYNAGRPIDGNADYGGNYYHGDQQEVLHGKEPARPSFLVALIVGIVTGSIIIVIMRSTMNSKRPQRSAAVYMNRDTYRVTEHQDIFLYSNVSKVKKQENPPANRGGGSSVHTSSRGTSHGGGGGKF